MRVFLLLAAFALLAGEVALSKKTFEGYVVYRTATLDKASAGLLRQLQLEENRFDFWKEAQTGMSAEIMASSENRADLVNFLVSNRIGFTIKHIDVQKLIDESSRAIGKRMADKNPRYALDWDDYYDHDTINEFIDELASTYEFVETVSIGSSYEGRDMRVIQINKAGAGAPTVWVEAGIHAREWISPAVATYIIRELVENNDAHPEYLDNINIHILPVTNPDGYEFSRSDDRFWRKTRSDTGSALGCKGVDSNRNYDYHWGESGVSQDKCSDTYPGSEPFSEIENQNVRDYVLAIDPAPTYANALHSAAELWLYPYGYAYDTFPNNVDEMIELGNACVDAIFNTHGIVFVCEHSAELYPAAGDSNDWYTGVVGARFAYTTELRDQGFGFVLPPEQIIPSGEEMWAAYEVALSKVIEVSKKEE